MIATILFGLAGIFILRRVTDYERNYITPLFNSILQELPSTPKQEAFVRQK